MSFQNWYNIGTIAIGDWKGIRDNTDYGKKSNQKLHQWAFGKITSLITDKAKAQSIKVQLIDEAWTSQTCPKRLNKKKPTNRNYKCPCGFNIIEMVLVLSTSEKSIWVASKTQ